MNECQAALAPVAGCSSDLPVSPFLCLRRAASSLLRSARTVLFCRSDGPTNLLYSTYYSAPDTVQRDFSRLLFCSMPRTPVQTPYCRLSVKPVCFQCHLHWCHLRAVVYTPPNRHTPSVPVPHFRHPHLHTSGHGAEAIDFFAAFNTTTLETTVPSPDLDPRRSFFVRYHST